MYGSSLEKRKDGPEFDQVEEMVRTINKRKCAATGITENNAAEAAGLPTTITLLQKNTIKVISTRG
jgi:hypothetical protein